MIEKAGAVAETKEGGIAASAMKKLGGPGMGRKGGEKRGFFGVGGGKGDADGEMDVDDDEEEGEDRRDGGARSLKKRGLGGVNLSFGR